MPTAAETVPGYTAGTWFGMSAPAGTPHEIITKINADVRQVMDEPEVQEIFVKKQLYTPITSSPEAFAAFIKAETARWARVIREQHLKIVR